MISLVRDMVVFRDLRNTLLGGYLGELGMDREAVGVDGSAASGVAGGRGGGCLCCGGRDGVMVDEDVVGGGSGGTLLGRTLLGSCLGS